MRSTPERIAASTLVEFSYEPYLIPYKSYYKPDFVIEVKDVNIVVEIKATANSAVRKQLREVATQMRHDKQLFIVALFVPHLKFRFTEYELETAKSTNSTLSGKRFAKWMKNHNIKWIEFSTYIPLTRESIYERVTRKR